MNILLIFLYDLWFLRYRECPYSVTFIYIYKSYRMSFISLNSNHHQLVNHDTHRTGCCYNDVYNTHIA